MRFKFTQDQLLAFSKLSHDRNPLHLDDGYARRTQFGRRVFYGVAAVLRMLEIWADGRSFRLKSLRADFKRPLFLEEEYSIKIQEQGDRVTLGLYREEGLRLKVTFTWAPRTQKSARIESTDNFSARSEALDSSDFLVRFEGSAALSRNYRIHGDGANQVGIPRYQLEMMAWSSYFTGMEIPGRQALFTGLEIQFDDQEPQELRIGKLSVDYNEQHQHVEVKGSADGVPSFELTAWVRPNPVDYPITELKKIAGAGKPLQGKCAFVSGGNRGFGSLLSRILALQGATVVIGFVSGRREAENVRDEIAACGGKILLAAGDLSTDSGTQSLLRVIEENSLMLDLLVNNAIPHPPSLGSDGILDQSAEDVLSYVDRALSVVVRTSLALIPKMNPDGVITTISSVLLSAPEPKYCSYLTAKSAIEGWIAALSTEMPKTALLVARLPRILTDMTNVSQAIGDYASAPDIARQVTEEAIRSMGKPGLRSLTFD